VMRLPTCNVAESVGASLAIHTGNMVAAASAHLVIGCTR
jgi:hypothetical protein